MTAHRYTAGPWRAVVTPQGVAVLPASVDPAMLDRIWVSLGSGNGLGAVLETLTGAFGTSLSSIPPFAVATIDGSEVRLAVRGDLTIDVDETDAAGLASSLSVSGADVTTWSERVVARGERLVFRTATAGDAPGDWFGIADGVVSCASIAVELAALPPRTATPTPAGGAATVEGPGSTADPASAPAPGGSRGAAPAPLSASAHVSAEAGTGIAPEDGAVPETTLLPEDLPGGVEETPVGEAAAAENGSPAAEAKAKPAPAPMPAGPEPAAASVDNAAPSDAEPAAAPADESAPAEPAAAPVDESVPAESAAAPVGEADASAVPSIDEDFGHTRSELPDDAYDHLWGATVVKSVEEAAVRESDDEDDEHAPAPVPAATPVAAPATAAATAGATAAAAPHEAAGAPAAPTGFAPPPAPPSSAAPPAPSSGLIDGVPDFGTLGAASGSASINGRTVPPLSPPPPAPATGTTAAGVVASPPDDDHDGLTVTVSELEAMRRLGAAAPTPELPASALGRIVLSTGETHPLDRPVIIGRRPRANRVQADQVPVLVAVASPEQDISRNHLEIRLEGRHVLVVDLATTNGSVLHREGTPPLRLGPNEPVLALSGDVVDIGDGVTVLFEEIP